MRFPRLGELKTSAKNRFGEKKAKLVPDENPVTLASKVLDGKNHATKMAYSRRFVGQEPGAFRNISDENW